MLISTALNKLLIKEPFFGYLALKLKYIETRKVNTMAVNGVNFWYSPDFIRNELLHHLIADIVHELLHCVFMHPTRGIGHIKEISQYAADYVVNDYIKNKTDFELQDWVLYEDRFQNMSYEAVYKILFDECKGTPNPKLVATSKKQGTFELPPVDNTTEIQTGIDDVWTVNIKEAEAFVNNSNSGISKAIQEIIDTVVPPQLPWQNILSKFFTRNAKNRTNWSQPKRRYAHTGLFLPSRSGKKLASLIIAVDTSSSVTTDEFQNVVAEVNKILISLKPEKLTLIHCDTSIKKIDIFTPRMYPITMTMHGRGATQFKPVFDYIDENKLNPNCLVYFSDLCGNTDFTPPKYPVLWINTDHPIKRKAAFGNIIGLTK